LPPSGRTIEGVDGSRDDLDASRAAVAARGLVATVAGYLTGEVAVHLPFTALVAYKDALKRFLSPGPWTAEDEAALADVVTPHLEGGWWEHGLGGGLRLVHGIADGRYRLAVTGRGGRLRPSSIGSSPGPSSPGPRHIPGRYGSPSAGSPPPDGGTGGATPSTTSGCGASSPNPTSPTSWSPATSSPWGAPRPGRTASSRSSLS
jgi:hypothetical protein